VSDSGIRALEPVGPVFRAVVETVVPGAAAMDASAWRDLGSLVDRSLAERPPALLRRLRLFLRLIDLLPLLRYGRRFASLDPQRRHRSLARLQESRIAAVRVGVWGVRTLALMGYYGRPDAARGIGYTPHPDGWEART
jgi:hypothetical protein